MVTGIETRRHLEAFPTISMVDVHRFGSRGETPGVIWRNRHGHMVGFAHVRWTGPTSFELDYRIDDLPYLSGGEGVSATNVVFKGSCKDNERAYAICGECGRHVVILAFENTDWQCYKCHFLQHRTSLVSKKLRLALELTAIEKEISAGRPKGMRHNTYAIKHRRMINLQAALRGERPTLPVEFLADVSAEWVLKVPDWLQFERHVLETR